MNSRIAWIEDLRNSINAATDGDIIGIEIEQRADPLKQYVTFKISSSWTKESFLPFQRIAHSFAKANNCVIEKIKKVPHGFCLEILTKTRLGYSKINPFGDKAKSED